MHTFLTVLINDAVLCSRVFCWGSATGGADSDVAASEPGTPAEDKESGQAFGGGEFLIGQGARHLAVSDWSVCQTSYCFRCACGLMMSLQ